MFISSTEVFKIIVIRRIINEQFIINEIVIKNTIPTLNRFK